MCVSLIVLFFVFLRYPGLSLLWPLPSWRTGSGRAGSVAMAHGPSLSLRSMWDPPRLGHKPVSPASAGRLLATVPPGKPRSTAFFFFLFLFFFSTRTSHCHSLSHCRAQAPDAQAQWPWLTGLAVHGMWDLPRSGHEPVSPASAGRLSTTAPPGKPSEHIFN